MTSVLVRRAESNVMLKEDILKELEACRTNAISGQVLADNYKVTRNSIWKAVNSLKRDGYNIISSTNRGYMLADDNDIISNQGINVKLNESYRNIPIYVFKSIDSTNSEAKRMLANDDSVKSALIVSEGQDKGKSRHAGGFYSPACTGVYMSIVYAVLGVLSKPQYITMKAGLAVIRAVKAVTGVSLCINNENDILYHDLKAGGILTEALTGLETGLTSHIIVGIGINTSTEQFPETIEDKAVALSELDIRRNDLIAAIVNEILPLYEFIEDDSFLEEYNKSLISEKSF